MGKKPLSVDLWSENVMMEKIRYIHENPVRAGLCAYSDEYKYSSALLYKTGIDNPSTNSGRISHSFEGLNSFDCW